LFQSSVHEEIGWKDEGNPSNSKVILFRPEHFFRVHSKRKAIHHQSPEKKNHEDSKKGPVPSEIGGKLQSTKKMERTESRRLIKTPLSRREKTNPRRLPTKKKKEKRKSLIRFSRKKRIFHREVSPRGSRKKRGRKKKGSLERKGKTARKGHRVRHHLLRNGKEIIEFRGVDSRNSQNSSRRIKARKRNPSLNKDGGKKVLI